MPELVNRLPPHFCRRMGVLPVRVDAAARTVEVAAADPLDPHLPAEVAFHLGVPVRVLRAPIAAIEDAIRRIELEAEAAAGRARRATPPFPHGAPESSNPPPPPPDPAPIPLIRRTVGGEKPPDTLRLYKATLRPGALSPDPDPSNAAHSGGARGAERGPSLPPESETAPIPLRATKPFEASEPDPASEPVPRTLRGSVPRLRDLLSERPPPESTRAAGPESARGAGPESARPRSARDSVPRLRDLIDHPPPLDKLRDSTPRLRDLAAALTREAATPTDDTAPVSSMVAQEPGPPAEPPAVSFPSMPPPSITDQPGLLAADEEWLGPVPAAPAAPEPAARARRPPSRFARPAIDIQLPQPPSERARRQRATWDVPMGGGGGDPTPDAPAVAAESRDPAAPPEPLPARGETLDTSAVLEALRVAGSRDDVVVAALRGLRTVGRRAAIFIVRRDGFHGWACNVELGDQEQLRRISVAHDAPSLFATAVATGSYFGPIPLNAVHAALIAVLEHPASDVAVAVARAGGKPVMVLFADDLVDIKRKVLPRLMEISDAVGAALSRLLAARL